LFNKYEETWNYLENFDILGLMKTWMNEKKWQKMKSKLLSDFIETPTKEHRKGKIKGGITAVRKRSKERKRN